MDVCLGIRKARGEGFLAFACDTGDIMEYITLLHGYPTHSACLFKIRASLQSCSAASVTTSEKNRTPSVACLSNLYNINIDSLVFKKKL